MPWKVLIAEDVEDLREIFSECLRFAGYDVVAVSNGAHALLEVERTRPDLILMDAAMPGVDGWEATRRLKADRRTQGIPVLMLTAHVFQDARQHAREVGADGFITKPCLPDELVERVRKALEESGRPPHPGRIDAKRPRSTRRRGPDTSQ